MAKKRFTDKWLKHLPPPRTGRLEFVDAICPGLQLRLSYKGTKTFSVVYRIHGRLLRTGIGRYPLWSLADARRKAQEILRGADEGIDPRIEAKEDREAITYAEMVEAYTDLHLKPNVRSWRNISSHLRHARLNHFKTRKAASIEKREIVAVIDKIVTAGMPAAAINSLRYLKMVFNWAAGRDMVPLNPCNNIPPPARAVERDRILSNDEIVAVWNATYLLPSPFGEMFRMFMLTGQRRTEVSNMRWSHLGEDVWTIPRELVKKDRAHAIPLTREMIKTLPSKCFCVDNPYIFSTTGGKSPSSNYCKMKRKLDELSGTSGWRIHDIRRTVRSKLAELRVPQEVARKITNHADGKIDRIYNRHEYLAEKREALEKWENHLMELLKQRT